MPQRSKTHVKQKDEENEEEEIEGVNPPQHCVIEVFQLGVRIRTDFLAFELETALPLLHSNLFSSSFLI